MQTKLKDSITYSVLERNLENVEHDSEMGHLHQNLVETLHYYPFFEYDKDTYSSKQIEKIESLKSNYLKTVAKKLEVDESDINKKTQFSDSLDILIAKSNSYSN